jgi:dTDP-4-amino-4,6-dideoxygalactose transaminase
MRRFLGAGVAVGVHSATAGLFLALKGLGIGPGDEVITVPNSDLSTTAAISHTGARFVLCDVEPDTFNLDPAQIEPRVTPRTRALLVVHLYGHPAEMEPLLTLARRRRLVVVEDAALALGARSRGQPVGLLGDAGVFSFSPRKVVGALGSAGMVVTRDRALADRIRLLAGYGQDPATEQVFVSGRGTPGPLHYLVEGHNLRLDALQAAILGLKLAALPAWQAWRTRIADRYAARFAGSAVVAPAVRPHCTHAFRNYVIRVPERDAVQARLDEQGIATRTYYSPPVHLQPVYEHLELGPGSFPEAERAAAEVLCLPIYPGMPEDHAEVVAGAVLQAVARAGRPGRRPG